MTGPGGDAHRRDDDATVDFIRQANRFRKCQKRYMIPLGCIPFGRGKKMPRGVILSAAVSF